MSSAGAIIATSEIAQKPNDWTSASIEELIAHIVLVHHALARRLLQEASVLMGQLVIDPDVNRFDCLDWRFHTFASEMRSHLDQEELLLFPACIVLDHEQRNRVALVDPAAITRAIHALSTGHADARQDLAALMARSHDLVRGPVEVVVNLQKILSDLHQDLQEHSRMEEEILLPAVLFLQDLSLSMHTSRPFSKDGELPGSQPPDGSPV
jgi:iron-sulfur cluster repair protein YtfE (RIC family)